MKNLSFVPKEDMERIFEPFYTKKVMGRSGTGLDMAIVLQFYFN
jgi:two-component system cell cycle sensor histidine kinase/response regulator CckA